jgi:Domain of unknown function (DUF4326)
VVERVAAGKVMTAPRIYNIRKSAQAKDPVPPDGVYVGRAISRRRLKGSPWGNPFVVGKDGDLPKVLDLYRQYAEERMQREPDWLEPLRGQDLVCWCQSPSDEVKKPCHAEIVRELANRPKSAA